MSNQTELILSGKQLTSLSRFPASLQGVKSLSLSNNRLSSLLNINYLPNLVALDASRNALIDIEDVVSLRYLKVLKLSFNQLTSLTGIEYLHNLEHLDLSNNKLISIDILTKCTNLKTLDLSSNQINSLANLSSLRFLSSLNLSLNPITSLPASCLPPSLLSADFSRTSLDSVSSLNGLASSPLLSALKLDHTPIFSEAISRKISLCIFCLFLCPKLNTFNSRSVGDYERESAALLFTNKEGTLDPGLLKLLLAQKKTELFAYLSEVATIQSDVVIPNQQSKMIEELTEMVDYLKNELNLMKGTINQFSANSKFSNQKMIDFSVFGFDVSVLESSAVHIQAVVRGFLARRRLFFVIPFARQVYSLKNSVHILQDMFILPKILTIQRVYRGYKCRKQFNNISETIKKRIEIKNEAAKVIQQNFRRYYLSKNLEKRSALLLIQAVIRGFIIRRKFSKDLDIARLKSQLSLLSARIS
ncbi:hypothetical protein RCL1_003082 [Eukaryota sp. TZLM3-RCL]